MAEDTFKKRSGTTARGKDYEDLIVAHLILYLFQKSPVKNFEVSSNNEEFGIFDDVILEMENGDAYAIQLKHSNQPKNLSKSALSGKQGKFSLLKYYEEYEKLDSSTPVQYVLFTNRKLSTDEEKLELCEGVVVKIVKNEPNPLLNTSEEGRCYKFEVEAGKYRQFFENFVLYTNQANADVLKQKIWQNFGGMFSQRQHNFNDFLNFVTKWSNQEGKKSKLDKIIIERVLTLCLLSQNIVEHSFESVEVVNQNSRLLKEALSQFVVTFIKPQNLNLLRRIYSGGQDELPAIIEINQIGKKYQVISKHISEVSELSNLEKSKLLWLLDKLPLMLSEDPHIYEAIRLCDSGSFVILSDQSEAFPITNVDNVLDDFCVCLQDKKRSSLRELLNENEEFWTVITPNELLQMTEGPLIVGGGKEELPVPYINRLVSTITIDSKFLNEVKDDTLVVIKGRYDFVPFFEEIEDFRRDEKIVFINDKDRFEDVCKKHSTKRKFHYFNVMNEKLEWIQSSGDLKDFETCRISGNFIEESAFANCYNRLEVICAEPGMGKSILIKSIKNQIQLWTVIISPKDLDMRDTHDISLLVTYLDTVTKKQNIFDSKFLDILIRRREIVLIWDGVDEVCKEHLDKIISLIKELHRENFIQIVTARNHLKRKLEIELNVLARTIKPVDHKQQEEYVRGRLRLSESDDIVTRITKNVEMLRCHDILEIPLHLYMLTELLLQSWERYKEILSEELFPITDLYGYFVDEKFNIYCREKVNLDDSIEVVRQLIRTTKRDRFENYQRAALNLVFSNSRSMHSSFLEEIRDSSDCCGIITSVSVEGIPSFIHQSFGEYFVAEYLVKNYKNLEIELLFTEEFTNIRFFFDLLMAKGCPGHLAVLYQNLQMLTSNLNHFHEVDEGGRTPLHLACSWGTKFYPSKKLNYFHHDDEANVELTRESFENQQIIQILCGNCDPYQIDDIFKMDAFSYANKSSSLFPMLTLTKIHQRNLKGFNNFKQNHSVLIQSVQMDYVELFDIPDISKLVSKSIRQLLVVAVVFKALKVLKRLLCSYKFEFGKDDKYHSIVNLACTTGNIEVLRLLSQAKVDFNKIHGNGCPPLCIVCTQGHLEAVKMLLDEHKVDINSQDLSGNTAIFGACSNGHFNVVKFLVEGKINYNHLNKVGTGILLPAAHSGNMEIVRYLTELGVDPRVSNKFGVTPLFQTVFAGHVEVAQFLLSRDIEVDTPTKQGVTPLHMASEKGNPQMVGLLLDKGADPNLKTNHGSTSLHLASFKGNVDVVRLLLATQADVNEANRSGITPLFMASEEGHSKVVRVLVDAGADVNHSNRQRYTPLHVACENDHTEVVRILLEAGADVKARSFFGRTAQQLAKNKGRSEIVELLQNYTK